MSRLRGPSPWILQNFKPKRPHNSNFKIGMVTRNGLDAQPF